ncbi:MAG: flagellar biosynthesis anti-sigma factor FlgM [Nitrospirae bacterium]|nr:MAG: flagellar biosynthesis anti-sigma factor FlgM [Nitrospirota bacterium]
MAETRTDSQASSPGELSFRRSNITRHLQSQVQASDSPKTLSRSPERSFEHEAQRLKDATSRLPEIRQDRIARLRHALQQGQYTIDSNVLAGKIIEETVRTLARP